MGLLDALFSGPQNGGGGLLDFLRNNAAYQPMMAGLPSDQAQYAPQPVNAFAQAPVIPQQNAQPSPLDNAQWPAGPVGAPSQANAQMPTQQPLQAIQAQAAPQDNGPGIGDRIGSGFRGFMANAQTGPIGAILGGVAGLAGMGQGNPANLTAKALLQKGVDPTVVQAAVTNPELMKTLVTQTFGPQNVTSIGGGYVWDPRQNKAIKAYENEDKIPAGFQKTDAGLTPIPGGPADPAYLRLKVAKETDPNAVHVAGKGSELYKTDEKGNITILHKNVDVNDATLDDPTTKAMAAQYLAGDKSVMMNLGRGAQGAANIVKIRGEIYRQAAEQGLDGKAIVNNFNEQAGALAGQRSIGTRAANISLAANEANNMIPIALDASAKVPRGEWMPWNKMVQAYQTGTSSPELARFVAATNSLVNSYVRAVSPSGVPTDSMREHAYSMLNSAQSPQAYQAVTSIMQDEMKAAMAAPGQVRKELRHEENPPEAPKSTAPDQSAIEAEMKRRGLLK